MLVSATEVSHAQNNGTLLASPLNALCALCNGQPDLLDDKGTDLLVDLLKSHQSSAPLVASIVKLMRLTCIKHERNRQAYVTRDIISLYVSTMETHKNNPEVVKEVCFALRVLTFDDDMRVPFGKAHEHAKLIVTEEEALRKILAICKGTATLSFQNNIKLCKFSVGLILRTRCTLLSEQFCFCFLADYCEDRSVLGELFSTLSRLAVRNEFCQEIMDLGGLELMLKALAQNSDHQVLEPR